MLLLLFGGRAHAIAAAATITISTTGVLSDRAVTASASVSIGATGALTAPAPLRAASEIHITTSVNLAPPGFSAGTGLSFAAAGNLRAPVGLQGAAAFTVNTAALLKPGQIELGASPGFTIAAFANLTGALRETTVGITIDGVNVKGRVRMAGLTIRDVLNDAPNTCTFTIEGDGPAVGQSVRVTLNDGRVVLFAGAVQTVDQSYESMPQYLAWNVSAIDDTGKANARRPFGTFLEISATTIAQTIAANFAPTFSTAGIEAGLPPVTIVFDGADTLIACLAKLATAIGGYCKIEDGTIYLFTEDTSAPPEPIDAGHPFLNTPPIQSNTDASQLRTRVYGKGYGESIPSDLASGETLIPIRDGVMFPPLGGDAIVGLTASGAQSERVQFTGVELSGGGTLVGPGAAPTAAPVVAATAGAGVDSGTHTVSIVFLTAAGKTLASPPATVDVGIHAPPGTAPTAGTATDGTGPDQGTHDYAVAFQTSYGETLAGPISNPIATSAASGQIDPPAGGPNTAAQNGSGVTDGTHDYAVTFTNAKGETNIGPGGQAVTVGPIRTGVLPPPVFAPQGTAQAGPGVGDGYHMHAVTFLDGNGETTIGPPPGQWIQTGPILTGVLPTPTAAPGATASAGAGVDAGTHYYEISFGDAHGDTLVGPYVRIDVGNGGAIPKPTSAPTPAQSATAGGLSKIAYWWTVTFGNAVGETEHGPSSSGLTPTGTSVQLNNIPIGPAGTTKRKVYRQNSGSFWHLVATINDNSTTSINDGLPDASWGAEPPTGDSTSVPYHVVNLTSIQTGPAGTLNRKVWRTSASMGRRLAGTVGDNTTTTFTDTVPNASLGGTHSGTNTTGSMTPVNQIAVTGIPIGPSGTTARRLYRNPNIGQFKFVAEISGNTATTYLDTTPDASLGANPPPANTTGTMTPFNQVNVTNIAIGPGGTTGRRLYRRPNQSGPFLFVGTINNNSITSYLDTKTNQALGAEAPASNTTGTAVQKIPITNIPIGPAGVTARKLYRRFNGAGTFRLVTTINNNTGTTFTDAITNAALGAAALTTPTAIGNQILVTVQTGGAAVTAREIYMSPIANAIRHLVGTLADNTTPTFTITTADAALTGPVEPIADTSGLTQPQGQVNPGATVLPVASAATFRVGGGWVTLGGGQTVRYTNVSGQTLTGIPPDGPGAITTTVLYGSQAIPAPMLIGVVGLTRPVLKGSNVHIFIQRDDLQAQAEQQARAGGDGVIEYLISDERRGVDSLTALCDADLAMFSRPIITVAYATRDTKTKSGKTVIVDLPSQRLNVTLIIQEVTITEIDIVPFLAPRFMVKAANVRFSLEDTLRRLIVGTL